MKPNIEALGRVVLLLIIWLPLLGHSQNSSATVTVKNNFSGSLQNVMVNHRYDNDHFDAQTYKEIPAGQSSAPFMVKFWTGFLRTGHDYWDISFEAEGRKWSCKDNFYCTLSNSDNGKMVEIRVYKKDGDGKMDIDCPHSGDCVVSLASVPLTNNGNARPFYLIAHRCNDNEDLGLALSSGCNAVECDLQYDNTSGQIYVNHDNPSGNKLSNWLVNAKKMSELYPEQFSLVIFDCKFAAQYNQNESIRIINKVRQAVRTMLNNSQSPINVLFSVASFSERDVIRSISDDLLYNEGISIDEWDSPNEIAQFFTDINVSNAWYGNGISAMWEDAAVFSSLKTAAEIRDTKGHFKKTYVWTLASENSIREFIDKADVDGILINVPGTIDGYAPSGMTEALTVISQTSKIRLAKRSDKAFILFK